MLIPHTTCLLSLFLAAASTMSAANDSVRKQLKSSEEFQGYSCAPGFAWFFNDGRLANCTVSRETAFGEITIPAGSEIFLAPDGRPRSVFLAHDARVNGYLCRGGKRAWSTALYPSGKLKTCWLAEDTVVDGVPCMRAGFVADVFGGGAATDFQEDGRLRACKLARDFKLGDRVFRRGDHIRLDAAGKLISSK